jgi:bacillithiol biosynthesis cysteine-adding enzyme BshC
VFDSSDGAAKAIARDVFAREVSQPTETGRLAADTGAALVARGYHAQVQPSDNALAIFALDGGRRPVRSQHGRFSIGEREWDSAALLKQVLDTPSSFSPNVLLRPIVQDTLFPTVCYVGGPSELAYLAQLGDVYKHFGLPMPLVQPRASATLADSAALRFLQKYRVPLEALQAQDESALNDLLKAQIPPAVDESFAAATSAIDAAMGRVVQAMPLIDATLEGAARNTLGKMQHELTSLHGKMIQAAKRRDETLRRQFTRTRALIFPGGHPQERAIGFVSFLNQYGPALVDRLDRDLPLDFGHHWLIVV